MHAKSKSNLLGIWRREVC